MPTQHVVEIDAQLLSVTLKGKTSKEGGTERRVEFKLCEELQAPENDAIKKTADEFGSCQVTMSAPDESTIRFRAEVSFATAVKREEEGNAYHAETKWTFKRESGLDAIEAQWASVNSGCLIDVEVVPDGGPLFREPLLPGIQTRAEPREAATSAAA